VWIGVEHAVDEAHFQIRTGDQRRHVGRFDADVLESAVVGDLLAADVLHRDDSLGAQLRMDRRDDDAILVREVVLDLCHDRRFATEIQLLKG